MPVMDGILATRAMRDWERAEGVPPLPILALTADVFREPAGQALADGFTAYLTKPIAKATLMDAIVRYAPATIRPLPLVSSAAEYNEQAAISTALAPRYLKNVERSLDTLHEAEAAEDYGAIQRIGHTLSGTGSGFGFPRITELGALIVLAAKERATHKIRSTIHELASYLEQVQSNL